MTAEEIVARLIYRDGLMLVIDKPAGLPVHKGPKGGESLEDYFGALRFGLPRPPALAHRLDRDTSGCLVLGRHRKALAALGRLFKSGQVEKSYWAVVAGGPTQDEGRIELQGPSVGQDTGATYAADALFDLLNDPASGFQQRLVTNGPFESVSGTYYTLSHSGPIEIVGKTSPERAQDALVRLLNELETLDVLEGVSDEDLAIAKKHREVQLALTRERIAGLAPALAQWWSSAGLDYHLAYDGRMAAQNIDDLRRFAGTYVVGRPRVIGVLAPPETTDRLAAWLRHPAARSGP